jgi:hypothetical protein
MQDNIITWNLANWVSVVLMALLGFLALGTIVSFVKSKKGDSPSDTSQQTPQ